ncbi:hypothetical protein J4E85_009654 [Alternaria conjuncta]|uniref:uncharacterized protein n=1 Tax=Alternaria conjuncta TaxID=181017 RepID=UPI00221F516D|nr:uncharacterized protein J4E85_009654 [Alternaria conjuncta]KAI4918866.1 hypothetical protein J4E85_009654 [Alternaria conjuncta]
MPSGSNSYRNPDNKKMSEEEQNITSSYSYSTALHAYRPKAPGNDAEASNAKGAGGGESGQSAASEGKSSLKFMATPVPKDTSDGAEKRKMVTVTLKPKVKGKDTKDEGGSPQEN